MKIDIFNTNNKYSIIYSDPPWKYKDQCRAGKRGAIFKYDLMDLDSICTLPVNHISESNSLLFLWSTGPFLEDAFKVINSWGFKYLTIAFTWVKTTKNNKLFWGMGRYTRSNAEFCLLAKRGKGVKRQAANVLNVVMSKIEEHSKKPDEVRDKIVQLVGNESKKIELFSRKDDSIGWDVWGNETGKFNGDL